MIKYFSVENFSSIKDEVIFEANIGSKIQTQTNKALVFFGANASGKTNILKAITFVFWFFQKSFFETKPNQAIPYDPFIVKSDNATKFYLEFIIGENLYKYTLELTKEKVLYEKLEKNKLQKPIYERNEQEVLISREITEEKVQKTLKKSQPYFIVERCTEENYINVLNTLYRKAAKIDNISGGNANGVMQKALKAIKNNPEYTDFIVWFDSDRFNPSKDTNTLNKLSAKAKVAQSYPCIETWLLSHFISIVQSSLSHESNNFETQLNSYITNYKKSDCSILHKYIDDNNIQIAKANYQKCSNNISEILRWFA